MGKKKRNKNVTYKTSYSIIKGNSDYRQFRLMSKREQILFWLHRFLKLILWFIAVIVSS